MSASDRSQLDQLRLSDDAARRLLARASELDAARGRMVTVANLREAAVEAGISTHAFDAALMELAQQSMPAAQQSAAVPARADERPWRHARTARRMAIVVAGVLLVLGARLVSDARVPEPTTDVIVEPSSDASFEARVDTLIVTTSPTR